MLSQKWAEPRSKSVQTELQTLPILNLGFSTKTKLQTNQIPTKNPELRTHELPNWVQPNTKNTYIVQWLLSIAFLIVNTR